MQSEFMEPNWAAENLQTIRTLMERSAVYRRALAPIMTLAGGIGCLGGLAGWQLKLSSNTSFVLFWMAMACLALTGGLLLVRRQALKDSEPFWSPPTRRVAQALLPAFFIGLIIGGFIFFSDHNSGGESRGLQIVVVILWSWFYGCAVHAAGFFMPRIVRWLGWLFVLSGSALMGLLDISEQRLTQLSPHLLMAAIFGGLHLAYGIYLYFTEKKNPAA